MFVSRKEFNKIMEENKLLKDRIKYFEEKYNEGKVITLSEHKEIINSLSTGYEERIEVYKKEIEEGDIAFEKKFDELNNHINSLSEKLEGREAALLKLASEMNVDDIEYFIRKDIKGFEDFKNDLKTKLEQDNQVKLSAKEYELQTDYLKKQEDLYKHTAGIVFSPRMVSSLPNGNQPL